MLLLLSQKYFGVMRRHSPSPRANRFFLTFPNMNKKVFWRKVFCECKRKREAYYQLGDVEFEGVVSLGSLEEIRRHPLLPGTEKNYRLTFAKNTFFFF